MPRGRRKAEPSDEPKPDPHAILKKLIQDSRKLTDRDIWNHSLGGKKKNKKKVRATEREEDEELLHEADLNRTQYFHLDRQPASIRNGQLRDYQIEGVSWMVNLRKNGLNGILADEMGLGKTLQCIALLAHLRDTECIEGCHLVLVPKSTIVNWCREFEKWCPSFSVLAVDAPTKEDRKALIKEHFGKGTCCEDVVICSYDICMIEKAVLRKIPFEYIIVDEAHRLKNNASKLSRILRTEFRSKHRLLITGTPLQNNLRELWSLLNFLLPALFREAADFEAMFDFEHSKDEQSLIFEQLRVLLQPFLLRRLKKNVVTDLPPKTELILFVGMSDLQREIYKKLLLKEMDTLRAVRLGPGGEAGAASSNRLGLGPQRAPSRRALLNLVMQLRKCSCHPYLFEGVEDLTLDPFGQHLVDNCGKLRLLDKLLAKLKQKGSRVLLFSQMTRVLDIMEDFCAMKQYKYCRIDGSTAGEDRQSQMDEFNAAGSELFLFLLTTRAGGLGINLQTADVVVIYDSDWNPQCDLQAMDRAHRIGQKKPVTVYRLVTRDSVEERMLERAELKLRLDAMVIQRHCQKGRAPKAGTAASAGHANQSLMEMVQYGADRIFNAKGATVTDDDIDSILAASRNDTDRLKAEWEKKSQREFSELSLEFNYQKFENEDFSAARKAKAKRLEAERRRLLEVMGHELGAAHGGQRSTRLQTQIGGQRRKNYNEDAYFREKMAAARNMAKMRADALRDNVNALKAPSALPDVRYWQLFDEEAMTTLHAAEWEWFNRCKNDPAYNEEEHGHCGLSEDEQRRKERLLEDGFAAMTYRLYGLFVRCCVKFGRAQIDDIVEEMVDAMMDDDGRRGPCDESVGGGGDGAELPERPESAKREELAAMMRRYHTAFFERGPAVVELEAAFQRIEDGEKKMALRREREEERERRNEERMRKRAEWEKKREQMKERKMERLRVAEQRAAEQTQRLKDILSDRVRRWTEAVERDNNGIYKEIQIPDAKSMDNGFNKEIDRFLFLTTHRLGYGAWDEIHRAVTRHPVFRFNFFVKTRRPMQLKQRVDTILRACGSSKSKNKRTMDEANRSREQSEQSQQSLVQQMQNVDIGSVAPPNKKQRV